jgi:hypothetical protein
MFPGFASTPKTMKSLLVNLALATLLVCTFISNIVWAVYHFPDEGAREADPTPPNLGRRFAPEENPSMWAALEDTKKVVDPKLGTELTQIYNNYIQSQSEMDETSSSVGDEIEYVLVDVAFSKKLDKEEAREVLRPAVQVDFIECFGYMCSVRIPVSALKDISQLEAVHLLHLARGTTHS